MFLTFNDTVNDNGNLTVVIARKPLLGISTVDEFGKLAF